MIGTVLLVSTLLFALAAAFCDTQGKTRQAAVAAYLAGIAAIGAAATLFVAILGDDFSVAYVISYSSIDLPLLYKFSAFWAGQQGSFLLWLAIHACVGILLVRSGRMTAAGRSIYHLLTAMLTVLATIRQTNPMYVNVTQSASEVMKLRRESYVDAARTAGAGPLRILFSDILPNILGNVAVLFSSRLGGVILSVASLSFLGLGIQPPTPDWGVMVNDARSYFRLYPLLVLAPGGCIFALSVSLNILGDILRDRIDVRFDEFLS